MAKTNYQSVDEYISLQPDAVQSILQSVRAAIRKAVPAAEESISYQIPAYKLPCGPVLYFAAWKQHYSLYPVTALVIEAFKDELASYEVRKNTLRLPFTAPVPVKLIARMAKFRAAKRSPASTG